ncbi:hypothetical protein GH714_009710 [Hevea brasiliensis]|uniref:At5g58720/SDE5-like UBA-like domain-containing protein n=1 Tax=Hevea brasiliensis TaxID=3981 RepID=A0A6A6KD13_HEVBR|nr:hypothetical protein GH714_009710 [Hevea brasiliensis]
MHAISSTAQSDVNKKDLEELLEVFGSAFSLDDIASAYCQGRRDTNLAAEILCGMHGTTSTTVTAEKLADENATPLMCPFVSERTRTLSTLSSEWPSDNHLEKTSAGQNRTKELRSKKCSISMGTVSSVIGKEYAKPRPLTYESTEARKPLKLDSKDFPVSEIWSEKNPSSVTTRNKISQVDIEEFLFKMLGEGFQLDMPVIREVLDRCGYDMQQSTEKFLEQESVPLHQQVQQLDSAQRSEEAPKITCRVRVVKRSKAFGKLVVECPKDATREHKPSTAEPQVVTRKGTIFNKKAREADDKSCQKLIETRDDEVVSVKLHDLEPKESLDLMRRHLTSLCGIPSIKYLRVIMESNGEDTTKGKRKKLHICFLERLKMEMEDTDMLRNFPEQIMKQLEKESIEWNEEENGKTILIKVDVIDPKSLSFAKKYGVGNDNKRGPTPANVGCHF